MLQEDFPSRIQPDPAGKPFEQRLSDLVLDLENAAVQCCRGDGQLVGRLSDGALARHHIDKTQACHEPHIFLPNRHPSVTHSADIAR